MGQTSSQEIEPSVSPVKKAPAPPRPQEPPKLQPAPRPPSYAVPENKVLPTELPSRPLRSVSSPFSKSNADSDELNVDKENKPLENGSVNLDHNFFPEDQTACEISDQDSDVISVRGREKYKAPSPPTEKVPPVNSQGQVDNIFLDPFYNRAALSHRRTNSLDRLPASRVGGHPRRPVSAVNLTSSEHTIFEDPEEANQNNKYTSLPQKSTFPMDYSYAVTYAQLAGHRRKKVQTKLESEKEILLKRQSLPELEGKKDMEPAVDMYVTREGEIDLDNLTPKKKKYKAPAPPSTPKVTKHAVILRTHSSGSPVKTAHVPVSSHKKGPAPAEPPVDYDTEEFGTQSVVLQNQSVQRSASNGINSAVKHPPKASEVETVLNGKERISNGFGRAVDSPISVDIKIVGLPKVQSEKVTKKKVTQNPVPLRVLPRQVSGADPVSPTSPKSPPPPVKPKPLRSPDEGRFTFPSVPGKLDTDVVTVNGQIIPEVPKAVPVQNEVVSLSIDCKSEIIKAAVASPPVVSSTVASPLVTTNPVISSPKAQPLYNSPSVAPVVPDSIVIHPVINLPDRNGNGIPQTSAEVHPIQRENRSTIHLSSEGKTNLTKKQNSVDVEVTDSQSAGLNLVINGHEREEDPYIKNSKSETHVVTKEPVRDDVGRHIHEERTKDDSLVTADIKPIPLGLTADITVEKSAVCESDSAAIPQSQSGSESGVAMPLSDQSFESMTTGDGSVDVVGGDVEEEHLCNGQVSQGTMTVVPSDMVDRAISLNRSASTSSADSAKPMSPPLTPDDSQPPKMNSLLQNDIVAAAQVRVLKQRKPAAAPPPPRDPEEVFKEELAKIHKEREVRITRNLSRDRDSASIGTESDQHQGEASTHDVTPDKDNDSGIQACSFSEDWTPEHDLEDSDDESRSVLTSRSGMFYDGRKAKANKANVRPTNSMSSNARAKVLRKSDSDATDKFGSLRRFRDNVKHALSSVNRPSSKPAKLDKRSSLPAPAPPTAEPKQPVFRKLDPDAEQQPTESKVSGNDQNGTHAGLEHRPSGEGPSKDSDHQVTKKAGVAYVSGNGQIVLLPEFENPSSPSKPDGEDGHRAPKRWKKMKKFAYMATTRKKEKQKMEQLLRERVEEQERRMEAERQKQMEMEREFMKVRQVDKPILKAHLDDDIDYPIRNGNLSKTTSHREVPPKKSEPLQHPQHPQGQVTVNGTAQGQITPNDTQPYAVTSFSMPGVVQAPGVMANGQSVGSPIILTGNGHAYNPWLPTQPIQNPAYPASMGWGIHNYQQYPATSLPYDLTTYMQMLDINGQSMPMNNGLMNGYNIPAQPQVNGGGIQYNGTTSYTVMNPVLLQQPNSVEANNYNNKRSLKQTIYVNPTTVDDTVLNQMYAEYQNGNSQVSRKERTKTSNPLYYSSDEEEEYDVSDVHTGHTHSKGTVARISVPDHHIQHLQYDGGDAEMSSPCSVASSSADSGSPYPVKLNGTATQSARFRSGSTSDTVNLDESYSSADR